MPAALDALIIGLYVELDDFLGPRHRGPGRPPKLTDAELITLAVAQVRLAMPNDRQFLALASAINSASVSFGGRPGPR